jgi:hypothetical protein
MDLARALMAFAVLSLVLTGGLLVVLTVQIWRGKVLSRESFSNLSI